MYDMKVTHKFTLKATCPVDGTRDVYTVIVQMGCLLKCEDIVKEAERIAGEGPAYQEEITEKIARALHATVTTQGHHRCGVETTVVVGCEL